MFRASGSTVALVGTLAVSLGAVAACAETPSEKVGMAVSAAPLSGSAAGRESSAPPEGVDWTHPFNGLASPVSSIAEAVRSGGLEFTPHAPVLDGVVPEIWAPHSVGAFQGIALHYRFDASSAHPSAGLVQVAETPTDGGHWREFVDAQNDPAEFSVISIDGNEGALIQGGGVGRVIFTENGVDYDVTGPSVSPADVVAIASEIARSSAGAR